MSYVNPHNLKLIHTADDVRALYDGAGDEAKTGLEVELAFFDPATPDLATMSVAQNAQVRDEANAALDHHWVNNEPSSEMLEVAGRAFGPDDLKAALDDSNEKIRILTEKAKALGLKRSWFQDLPDKSAAQLLENIVDVERYQIFFNPPRDDMMDIATYFTVSKANQVSISYKDLDHMLANLRRLYMLAPFLFMLTDNASNFDQGKNFTGHAGMMHRSSLGPRGLVLDYLFSAKNGEDYIQAHIDHVFNNPLWSYYDENGVMQRVPNGEWLTMKILAERGLNTATNYFFSETVLWPDVKIAGLKGSDGKIFGHRYEARMFGVGFHQHQTALLIVAALGFDEDFAQKIDDLLREFGFCPRAPEMSQKHLEDAYHNARHHDNRFFDIPYGSGTMSDFAKKFAALLEEAYAGKGFDAELAPALTICRTGWTDTKVNRALFDSLEKTIEHQRTYDDSLFENPNQCAYMIYKDQL